MIYLSNRISTVFIFFTTFLLFLTICLVNLPMSPGCGDWTAGLFYGDDPYRVVGFWRRDINSVFISTSFGWFFICCGSYWLCLQAFLLWSLPFFLLFLLLLFILFACMTRNSPYAVFILHFCFLWTWTARHLILWRMASTWSVISIESENVISYLEGFIVRMKKFSPARLFLI